VIGVVSVFIAADVAATVAAVGVVVCIPVVGGVGGSNWCGHCDAAGERKKRILKFKKNLRPKRRA